MVTTALCLTWTGCRREPPAAPAPVPAPETLTIFYTCSTTGHIEPCACSSGRAGGLARRKAYLDGARTPDSLRVDAGDVTAGPRPWEVLECEFILKGYALMGYDAVNVGHRELALGAAGLRALRDHYDAFVSANVLDEQGKPIFAPYRVVRLRGGYRVGIVGVVDEHLPAADLGHGLRVAPAADALAAVIPRLRGECDMIVLLAFAPEDRLAELAETFYEVRVVVGGQVLQPSGTPETENRATIVYITDKGKSVGRLDFRPGDAQKPVAANEIVMLGDNAAEDPSILDLIATYKAELERRDFQPHRDDEEGLTAISAARSPKADRYIGSEACLECHRAEYEAWTTTRHAVALHSLKKDDNHTNPKCLACHTTGSMASDGYVNQATTPKLAAVSCEACHGRGAHHAARHAQKEEEPVAQERMKTVNCTTCHDEENSPDFERAAYWEKIHHGK